MGRKKTPHYRVVVADSTSPRDGRFVETLGYYKPLSQPARLVIDMERVEHWLSEGASPSGTVKSLLAKARRGGDGTVQLGEVDAEAREAKRAEELAARRAAEKKAATEKAEAERAAEAEKTAEQEAVAAAAADEAAATVTTDEATEEAVLATEAVETPAAEADDAPPAAGDEEEEKSE